ncbi:MAG: mandelate racemase/muconate lactonizing enzyme family protein [Nitrososphaerales archaeon]
MIREIEIVNGSIPLTKTDPEQLWTEEWSSQLFVKIVTEETNTGWGEVLPAGGNSRDPYVPLISRFRDLLNRRDEADYRALWNVMRRATFTGGYGITTGAISGVDIALWDIMGRRANVSLAKKFGGGERKVKRYASLSRYKDSETLLKLCERLLSKGYVAIKMHQSSSDTLESVALVRKSLGNNFDLMVDLNCAYSFEKAREFMRGIERYDLKWIEEPVWPPDDYDSLKKLNKLVPVAAGENFFSVFEFKRLLDEDALTYYQPDVAKIGGVTPAMELATLFKIYGAGVAFHNRPHNGWVGTLASANLVSGMGLSDWMIETPPNEIPLQYFDFSGTIDQTGLEPRGAGLGISPKNNIPTSKTSKLLKFHED